MAGKIIIDIEECKGCQLCVEVCPKKCIKISKISNKKGYFPAEGSNNGCTGCCECAMICPEVVIEVHREKNIVEVKSAKKTKKSLTREIV